jgi:hypothetical protein
VIEDCSRRKARCVLGEGGSVKLGGANLGKLGMLSFVGEPPVLVDIASLAEYLRAGYSAFEYVEQISIDHTQQSVS